MEVRLSNMTAAKGTTSSLARGREREADAHRVVQRSRMLFARPWVLAVWTR